MKKHPKDSEPDATPQSVYDRLFIKIMRGDYPPAQKLVNRSLAEELGVSVIPVREALNRLASEGLVKHIAGAGSFVCSLDKRELMKLYALREHLEVFAAVEAASHAETYHLQQMRRCCDIAEQILHALASADDVDQCRLLIENWIAQDAAFHAALFEAADNPWLERVMNQLRMLAHVARSKPRQADMKMYKLTLKEHRDIMEAIARHNPDRASSVMRKHIQRAMNAVLA